MTIKKHWFGDESESMSVMFLSSLMAFISEPCHTVTFRAENICLASSCIDIQNFNNDKSYYISFTKNKRLHQHTTIVTLNAMDSD